MAISIVKDDRSKRIIISGGNETLFVEDGVKPIVVDFVLAQEKAQAEIKLEIAKAKSDGDAETRKTLIKKYQSLALLVQREANKLQYN